MTRPLPDSGAYARKKRHERRRRIRRIVLLVLLLTVLAAIVYALAGGKLPDFPQWLEVLLQGGSEGAP